MVNDTSEKNVDSASRTILVVDDNPSVVKSMEVILQRAGFSTIGCLTGTDAMSKAAAGISAAVVDIHLPDVSGLTLSHQLREKLGPVAPIVILSGDSSMETLKALPDAGATYFHSKPVNAGMLIGQLKEWLSV